MHLLGHSFSQRSKRSKRPRDLHIRKVSFSGSSLSGCSLSSSGSTASACTAIIPPQYSAEHPPARLHERPYKAGQTQPPRFAPTFYDDDIDADDDYDYYGNYQAAVDEEDLDSSDEDDENIPHFEMEMPPHSSPADHDTGHDRSEGSSDYFLHVLAQRPPMPRSRWSESTIQSVQTMDAVPTPGSVISTAATETALDQGPPVVVEMPPNFSYKRAVSTPAATPKPAAPASRRPPMKTMDSIDEFVKRGGWKRRGIVFHQQEVDSSDNSF
jgi:hypothetical protein